MRCPWQRRTRRRRTRFWRRTRTVKSDNLGRLFSRLPPGKYEIMITGEGFVTQKREIHLQVDDTVILNVDLIPVTR